MKLPQGHCIEPRWKSMAAACAVAVLLGTGGCTLFPSAPQVVAMAPVAASAAPTAPTAPTAPIGQPLLGSAQVQATAPIPMREVRTASPPSPLRFEDAIARAGARLFADARAQLGDEARAVVIDPLVDANTGSQTVSTVRMGIELETLLKAQQPGWSIAPLTRQTLASRPLLLIGTLTPVNIHPATDSPPDAFRIWLTLIDLRSGRVVAKNIDRATVDSVNPEPLRYFTDSPTWHRDKTVLGYINSCQINTKIGDPADPAYLAHLPAQALVNEAMLAYNAGKVLVANGLYREASTVADPDDLRVLNGLYLTNWQLGKRVEARDAFDRLVASGFGRKRLPLKLLFQPGRTVFNAAGDLPQQYSLWMVSLAEQASRTSVCVRIVGHTSRTGSATGNEALSRRRAEAVQQMLLGNNRALGTRLTAAGVGSREALVGLGTDDQRDALDRRVEFGVFDCV